MPWASFRIDIQVIGVLSGASRPIRTVRTRPLFGRHGEPPARAANSEAIAELHRVGSAGSRRKWWAFEGHTEVDCYLQTDQLLLLVEGKRTAGVTGSTAWLPKRNQLVRNLEVASELAGGKEYAVGLIVEDDSDLGLATETIDDSVPHRSDAAREDLARHFLGAISWAEVCEALGIEVSSLPHTSEEAASRIKAAQPNA